MKSKSLLLLALAIGCGFVAMMGVQQILSQDGPPVDTSRVLVARVEIAPGAPITEAEAGFEDWPKASVPPGAVTDAKEIEGRALKARAFPGEVILQAKLGAKGAFGASASIPKGMRVVSVPVNATAVNSGMINPGDRVDILVSYKKQTGNQSISRTKTVLEYVEVFAIDRVRDAEEAAKGTKAENLSVIVTPENAALLMMAASKGQLQMSLRHTDDRAHGKPVAIDDHEFDGGEPAPAKIEPTPDPAVAAQEAKPAQDLAAFVNKEAADAVAAPIVAEPAKEVWSIEIFDGPTKRIEQIELPGTADAKTRLPAAPAKSVTNDKPVANAA